MKRADVHELQYIAHVANLSSILEHGIMSYRGAARLIQRSIANLEVQDLRSKKTVPGGRSLHDYANLYFHARNPMLYRRKDMHEQLCVLRIDPAVLDLDGVVVSDMNAARAIARFYPCAGGLAALNRDEVYAEDWRHPGDRMAYERHQGIKCAEVLVPDSVPASFVVGAFASSPDAQHSVMDLAPSLPVTMDPRFFFL